MLKPVSQQEIAGCWTWVKAGLEKLIAKTRDDWKPEDVYHELKSGVSFLYLIEDVGFIVLQKWANYHDGARLFVRAIWAEPNSLAPRRDELYDELKAIARQQGCVAMRMTSPRRWELAGWEPKQTIYEMEV